MTDKPLQPTKIAVIGAGHLGKFHAQKYAQLKNCKLVAIVDINAETAQTVADQFEVLALTDYRELLGDIDAVSITTPTISHHQIAADFLNQGSHVLIEKPITRTVAEADELIKLADDKNLVLQVGHLERFNAALQALDTHLCHPTFIESHRLAPFKPRSLDVNVILDLMIHDIDIIMEIVDSEIKDLRVSGTHTLTSNTDIANARLEFENGCVANVTASRISAKSIRKMRIFQDDAYFSVDFGNNTLSIFKKGDEEMFPGIPEIIETKSCFEKNDPLYREIASFIDSIQNNSPISVTGMAGRRALDVALRISRILGD